MTSLPKNVYIDKLADIVDHQKKKKKKSKVF